jgi:hypothetical protein
MKRTIGAAVAALALCLPAAAKLPPPTPEQAAAEQEKRAREQAQLEREKAALERAQDRVAERYRREQEQPPAARHANERVKDENMPKTARELPGDAGPQGGSEPSAEAHSAPAK